MILREYIRTLLEVNSHYIGIALEKDSRKLLLQHVPALHPEVHANHVTIIYAPRDEEIEAAGIGQRVPIRVLAVAADEQGQAVRVQLPRHLEQMSNRIPHITISTAEGVAPMYSNTLIRHGLKNTTPVVLFGIVKEYK